ncbi:unnamed protein product [Scytosiphon promiscuus]
MVAKESAGVSSSAPPKSAPAPNPSVVAATDAGAPRGSGARKSAVAMEGEQAAHAAGRGEVAASAATAPKRERDVDLAAGPETTAAEKVLTLLDIGLVGKEEVSAYYDALSELERTTREAKAAAAVAASSPNPSARPASAMPAFSARDGPLSLVPLPAVCAALGAAGTQSLHLAGGVGTAISIFGAMAGVAIGGLVVIGDDPLGRLARTAGAAVVRSTGAAGGAAGRSVSESVAGAAGAAAGAVENAVVKAPSKFAGGLARSFSGAVAAAFGSAVALPGALVTKAADGAKGALKETSDAAVAIPGRVARKASRAAGSALQTTSAAAAVAVGGALQSTTEAAVTAVKGSPEKAAQAAQRLNGPIPSPGKSLADFISLPSRAVAGASKKAEKVQRAATAMPSTSVGSESTAAPSRQAEEEEEPGGIPVQELEAKMLSVKKALERFDNVKARIEKADSSGTLFEAVGVTRSMNASAEMEKGEKKRAIAADAAAVAQRTKGTPMESSSSSPATKPARPTPTKSTTAPKARKAADQDRRKQVAEGLLEKASQRAAEAKAGLKAAAASARRGAEVKPSAVAASVAGGGASDL